jgi:dolichol-phosphate mannosyltransferase
LSDGAAGGAPAPGKRVWIVLPAFNEEASLPPLLAAVEETMAEAGLAYHVVVVDDGSSDATRTIAEEAARRLPLTLEVHPENLGLGAAIRDGLTRAAALAAPGDVVITMDADNSHGPELIPRMARRVAEGSGVVIASRYRPGSVVRGVGVGRRWLSAGGSWLFRVLFPTRGVRDFTCGFRAYRADVLQAALAEEGAGFFDQDGFQCMVDILLKLRRRGVEFSEVPLVLRYDRKGGASKMRVGRTIVSTLGLLARRRLGIG